MQFFAREFEPHSSYIIFVLFFLGIILFFCFIFVENKMLVVVVRHAHAAHNVTGDYSLHDPSLTEIGIEKCKAKQGSIDSDLIISSTSQRALQTAQLLFPSQKIYGSDLLLEYQTGVPCNKRADLAQLRKQFPTIDFDTYALRDDPMPVETTWEHGVERAKRIVKMLEGIKQSGEEEGGIARTVCLVGHGNILRNLLHETIGDSISLPNCGQFVFQI
jgi:broad specificity phosphatase PhoE